MDFTFRRGTNGDKTYFVLLHSEATPEEARWNAYLDAISRALAGSVGRTHVFVATDGGGPDPAQRKALARVFEQGDALTHVFTTSVVVRGIVTAFRWIAGTRAVAHQPQDFGRTCVEVGHDPALVVQSFDEAQSELAPVALLNELRRSALVPARLQIIR
ncbi:MAG TPA: hypothetical protein VFQ35_12585 [Polyangiaceae bacterium]|nr:hypothetical protein [Polyangiaceae bacterium]